MTRLDSIIAVKDVEASARWYQQIFGFRNAHGGGDFAVLLAKDEDEVMLCLHAWEAHHHPTLTDSSTPAGNGLLIYFRTENITEVRQRLEDANWPLVEKEHMNTNSLRKEFSFRDPDGYFLTVTEWHEYEG